MDDKRDAAQIWLLEKLTGRLGSALGASAIRQEPLALPPDDTKLMWRQDFEGLAGALWIAAAQPAKSGISRQVLRAADADNAGEDLLRSTYTETLGEVLSGIAHDFSARLGREIRCAPAAESAAPKPPASWIRLALRFPDGEIQVAVAVEDALLNALDADAQAVEEPVPGPVPVAVQAGNPKTFDLLLDVELPVSVSFGRAQVPLKDVIKLTTGSIVELNRSIAEPVEIIVNNCVIARGEVVVVEGNFGVRIQQVISRQERLRTLN